MSDFRQPKRIPGQQGLVAPPVLPRNGHPGRPQPSAYEDEEEESYPPRSPAKSAMRNDQRRTQVPRYEDEEDGEEAQFFRPVPQMGKKPKGGGQPAQRPQMQVAIPADRGRVEVQPRERMEEVFQQPKQRFPALPKSRNIVAQITIFLFCLSAFLIFVLVSGALGR